MSLVYLLVGLLVGALSVWFYFKGRSNAFAAKTQSEIDNAVAQTRASYEPQLATLNERLSGKETQIAEAHALAQDLQKRLEVLQAEFSNLKASKAEMEAGFSEMRKGLEEKIAFVEDARKKLTEAFSALAGDALKSNNQAFLEFAKGNLEKYQESARGDLEKRQTAIQQMVTPVKEVLQKFEVKLQGLETERVGAYSELREQVRGLSDTQMKLREETGNLVKALRQPQARGRWGEIQLHRVVEMAGMVDHCDFFEQTSTNTEEGRLRPDMIVRLPGGKQVVVDSKAPLMAYLEAVEAKTDLERDAKLVEHAQQIRTHMSQLGKKAYWEHLTPAPEFVVMFLPGEDFFSAALRHDPTLIEAGVADKVILATPTTLIALLKAVSYGWRQESLTQNAQQISALAKELYERLFVMTGHFAGIGDQLKKTIDVYNKAVGSYETRVLVTARKFKELGVEGSDEELKNTSPVEVAPREVQAALSEDNEDKSRRDKRG